MTVNITINVAREGEETPKTLLGAAAERLSFAQAPQSELEEMARKLGSEIKPFPPAKLGGYMSHFRIVIELNTGEEKPRLLSIVSPLAAQTVSWSDPFIYGGPERRHDVRVQIPKGSALPDVIRESDFLARPAGFFEVGKETMWLQILNLDARMDTDIGEIRIILGETLKRDHPDIFRPSYGVAQSIGGRGFPARLYFNPYALIETPVGAFRAIHGTLSYGRVTDFPPIGTPVSIADCIPLEPVDEVRALMSTANLGVSAIDSGAVPAAGRIIALSHPIDMEIQLRGEDIYDFVERCVAREYLQGPPSGREPPSGAS